MNIITDRKVITRTGDVMSNACGCSGADGTQPTLLQKGQNVFQKGKTFLDQNQGIKDTLGGILGGKGGGGSAPAPMPTYTVPDPKPEPKKGMSKGLKTGLIIGGGLLVLGVLAYVLIKEKKSVK